MLHMTLGDPKIAPNPALEIPNETVPLTLANA